MNWLIIIARNSLPLTQRALASALAQDIPVRPWLINNHSSDGTAQWANVLDPERVTVTHNVPQPPSLACTWNLALSYLFNKLGEQYALVCNNDIELRSDAYRLLLADGGDFVTCVGVSPEDWAAAISATPALVRSPHPDFSCFLIRRSVWEQVGPFDEGMLLAYCEDCDYHVRMHRAGIIAHSLDVPYLHHAASVLKTADRVEAARIRKQADVNRERFYQRYGARIGTPEYAALFC